MIKEESEEQEQRRLEGDRIRHDQRRATETAAESENRRERQRKQQIELRNNETEEEEQRRLEEQRMRQQQNVKQERIQRQQNDAVAHANNPNSVTNNQYTEGLPNSTHTTEFERNPQHAMLKLALASGYGMLEDPFIEQSAREEHLMNTIKPVTAAEISERLAEYHLKMAPNQPIFICSVCKIKDFNTKVNSIKFEELDILKIPAENEWLQKWKNLDEQFKFLKKKKQN